MFNTVNVMFHFKLQCKKIFFFFPVGGRQPSFRIYNLGPVVIKELIGNNSVDSE